MSTPVVNTVTQPDATYEIKMVDGRLIAHAEADVVKTIQDLIAKNTSNPLVKIALSFMSTLKSQFDWSGVKKDLNV